MILEILHAAHRLDEKLNETVGRPYHVFLGLGLVAEIAHRIRELVDAPLTNVIAILFGFLLLISQMGELSERLEQRRNVGPDDRGKRGRRRIRSTS